MMREYKQIQKARKSWIWKLIQKGLVAASLFCIHARNPSLLQRQDLTVKQLREFFDLMYSHRTETFSYEMISTIKMWLKGMRPYIPDPDRNFWRYKNGISTTARTITEIYWLPSLNCFLYYNSTRHIPPVKVDSDQKRRKLWNLLLCRISL